MRRSRIAAGGTLRTCVFFVESILLFARYFNGPNGKYPESRCTLHTASIAISNSYATAHDRSIGSCLHCRQLPELCAAQLEAATSGPR